MTTLRRAATLLSAATLLGCSAEPSSNALAPRLDVDRAPQFNASGGPAGPPRATGFGRFINPRINDVVRRAFNAIQQKDGTVVGNFVQHNASGLFVNGEINCLHFLSANEAVMSGPIRKSSVAGVAGLTLIFRVVDGGEGNDAADRMSGFLLPGSGSTLDCRTFVNPFDFPLEEGNIQVQRVEP
jgi:hypothetical protein